MSIKTTKWEPAFDASDAALQALPVPFDVWSPIYGKQAVFTTFEGERLVGVVEPAIKSSGGYPVIRFESGKWGRCDSIVELVEKPKRCAEHPAYEPDYCPLCGTTVLISER